MSYGVEDEAVMSHDWAVENKGGHPQPWLPAPFALCLAHAPPTCTICFRDNTNALVEGCKMYAVCPHRKSRINVWVIS